MGKIPIVIVALLLLGVFRLYSADLGGLMGSASAGGAATATVGADVATETMPAEEGVPDLSLWFKDDPAADPYSQLLWTAVEELLTDAERATGWTTLCTLATTATGADRTANPLPGALACSEDASVTELQQLAVAILRTQASTALWMRGAPGYSGATIAARQGEVSLLCATGTATRGDQSIAATFVDICNGALDASWKLDASLQKADGPATFAAVKAAYADLADIIAERDATADATPTFYNPPPVDTTESAPVDGAADTPAAGSP